jgi:crossover junction endodeoxyribonuclease RuvC
MKPSKIILGIDPGLVNTGWGIILKENNILRYIASGTIKTNSKDSTSYRLKHIYSELFQVFNSYIIDEAAIEETFVNKNNLSSLKLGQARGAIILSVSLAGISLSEYSATNVKKSVVGVGRADKNQISSMVKVLLPKSTAKSEHEADALAIAICHANNSNFLK